MPTTQDKVNIWYSKNGKPLREIEVPEAASQTFKRGDLVYRVSGKATLVTLSTLEYTSAQTAALGIALKDATNNASPQATDVIPVAVIDSDFRWVLPVTDADANAQTAVTLGGVSYPLQRTSAGNWAVNIESTSNPVVTIETIHPQYPVPTEHGWVVVKFIATELEEGA